MQILAGGKVIKYDFNSTEDVDKIINMINKLQVNQGFYLVLPDLMNTNRNSDSAIIKFMQTAALLNNGTEARIVEKPYSLQGYDEFTFVVRRNKI